MKEIDSVVGIAEAVAFVCPFCGKRASAGYDETGRPLVLHTAPACKTFMDLEPADYMASINDKNGYKRPS